MSYVSNSNASDEVDVALRLHQMHLRQDPANVTGQSGQNLNGAGNITKKEKQFINRLLTDKIRVGSLGVCQQANVVLGIRAQLRLSDQVDAILLHIHPGRKVVSIALIIAVIKAKQQHL